MRCLMCEKELGYGSLTDILFGDDPLCHACRVKWKKKRIRFMFEGHRLRSSYVYNEAFSSCLIRYKELGDEALKDAFLYEDKNWFRRTYIRTGQRYSMCVKRSYRQVRLRCRIPSCCLRLEARSGLRWHC